MTIVRRSQQQQQGFTFIELIMGIAIIALLVGMALPIFRNRHAEGFMAQVRTDTKNAYTAALAFFSSNPEAVTIVSADLFAKGYRQTQDVTLAVTTGSKTTFSLVGSCKIPSQCSGSYQMSASGQITDTLAAPK